MKSKKMIAMVLALVLCASCFCGCSKPENTRAFTVNGTKVMMDETMYYIYNQEMIYSTYDQLYQMMYNISFWDASQDGVNTMSSVVKREIVSIGAWYTILSEQAEAEGFTLSEEKLAKTAEDAQGVFDEMTDVQKKKTGLTVETLTKVFRKIELATEYYVNKVEGYEIDRDAIRASVSREDYRQYNIEMLQASFTDEAGTVIDKGEQTLLIKKIDSFVEDAEAGKDLAELLDEDETDVTYTTLSFTAEELTSSELNAVASELENGKVTTYQNDAGYYLIRMVDNNSDNAYEKQVKAEIQAAENKMFEEEYAELAENSKIKVSRYFEKLKLGKITTDEDE